MPKPIPIDQTNAVAWFHYVIFDDFGRDDGPKFEINILVKPNIDCDNVDTYFALKFTSICLATITLKGKFSSYAIIRKLERKF